VCLSIPGRVVRVEGAMAEVKNLAGRRWFNALAVPEVRPGDWVYTYANLVAAIVTEEEARAAMEAAAELDARLGADDRG
jgi:hydrogenase assembly chaperone HypC/HupF